MKRIKTYFIHYPLWEEIRNRYSLRSDPPQPDPDFGTRHDDERKAAEAKNKEAATARRAAADEAVLRAIQRSQK